MGKNKREGREELAWRICVCVKGRGLKRLSARKIKEALSFQFYGEIEVKELKSNIGQGSCAYQKHLIRP